LVIIFKTLYAVNRVGKKPMVGGEMKECRRFLARSD